MTLVPRAQYTTVLKTLMAYDYTSLSTVTLTPRASYDRRSGTVLPNPVTRTTHSSVTRYMPTRIMFRENLLVERTIASWMTIPWENEMGRKEWLWTRAKSGRTFLRISPHVVLRSWQSGPSAHVSPKRRRVETRGHGLGPKSANGRMRPAKRRKRCHGGSAKRNRPRTIRANA